MKYLEFFKQRVVDLPSPNEKGEVLIRCIFHPDNDASLGINLESGKWKCYAPSCPGHRGGGYKKFEMLINGELPGVEVNAPFIDPSVVEAHHKVLLQSSTTMGMLQKKRGYTLDTIQKFKLGYDADRVWIPIFDAEGNCVNVRKYKSGASRDKMVAFGAGYNRARLFPIGTLQSPWLLLCEGETDCILAAQFGYPAITTTGGADTWREEFSEQLRGKKVVICYDSDASGKKGASQAALRLLGYAEQVKIIHLPLPGTKEEKDLTNFFVDLGHSSEDFDRLIESAEVVLPIVARGPPPEDVLSLHLSEIGEDIYVGKRVQSTVLVAGKDLAPFQVPFKLAYSCDAVGSEKMCDRCGICKASGQKEVTIPEWSEQLLQMINVPIEKLESLLAKAAQVPYPCRKFKYEVKEYTNIEAIKAIPEIDFNANRSEYVIRNLFYLGHGLESNHTYKLEAVVMPEPKTQYATALVYKAEPSQDSIEKFEMTDELNEILRIFQTDESSQN